MAAEWERLKDAANKCFAAKNFVEACALYSQALELNPTSEVLLANRAFAQTRRENYGLAIEDATRAIQLAPSFPKGYYRRGIAYYALCRHKLALADMRVCAKLLPGDRDVATKLKECERAVHMAQFEAAIARQAEKPAWQTIDLNFYAIDSSYNGPKLGDEITLDFVTEMMEWFRDQKLIPTQYAFRIILRARELFEQCSTLNEVHFGANEHFTVCGDIHGQYYDLLNIFKLNGLPSESNPYLFNGDFVDRGSFSVEVILTMLAFKCLYPNHFHMARGNHESKQLNSVYGFSGEVKAKYNDRMLHVFNELFCFLPLATLINRKIFVVHGGLFSKDGVTLDDIRKVDRIREPPDEGLMCEMLWSDPMPMSGRSASKRGVGVQFGPNVTHSFLDQNGLKMIIRSHEVKEEGYEVEAGGRLVTVFSAPNYCDQMGNKGAFIRLESDLEPKYTSFEAVPHPPVRPMQYAGNSFLNMM